MSKAEEVEALRQQAEYFKANLEDIETRLQRVPTERPRLFFPGERLQQIRHWAKGELKPAIDSLVRSCEREIGKELVEEPGYRPKGPEYGPWAVKPLLVTVYSVINWPAE